MVKIILEWPDEDHEVNMLNIKRTLNYQEEIPDPENLGELIPNPLSIEDVLEEKLRFTLNQIIESGAANEAEDVRVQKIDEAKIRTGKVTVTSIIQKVTSK